MNILYYTWDEIISNDIMETLQNYGCNVVKISYNLKNNISDSGFIAYVENILHKGVDNGSYDYIFSCNFLPVISKIALRNKIKYLSWCYDSPCTTLYSDMIYNPYNYIFHFDNYEVLRLKEKGVVNVFHLPLAVNTKRIELLLNNNEDSEVSNITFMGNLYTENEDYDQFYCMLDDYLRGRIDALINIQGLFLKEDILDEMLDDNLLGLIQQKIEFNYTDEFTINNKDIIKQMLYKKTSSNDRLKLVKKIADKYEITLYSNTNNANITNNANVNYRGILEYYNDMPVVFNNSKININTTLRSIHTGIPLRAIDIMAAGGFLLTDYQLELAELFVEGEDMVIYYDEEDMMNKIEYYLKNDYEREQIAASGKKKINQKYDYSKAWEYIFSVC